MTDTPLPSSQVIEALGRVELDMKRLGLAAQAAGVRAAIVAVIRLAQHPDDPPSIDPSDPP